MLQDEMRIETLGNFAKYVLERRRATNAVGPERGGERREEGRKQEGMIDANYAKAEGREAKEKERGGSGGRERERDFFSKLHFPTLCY